MLLDLIIFSVVLIGLLTLSAILIPLVITWVIFSKKNREAIAQKGAEVISKICKKPEDTI